MSEHGQWWNPDCREWRAHFCSHADHPNAYSFHYGHERRCRVCDETSCGGACESVETMMAADCDHEECS